MNKLKAGIAAWVLSASALALVAGCASAAKQDCDDKISIGYVPIAQYAHHLAGARLEALHRIQINDISGLRNSLEGWLALDVVYLWAKIQDTNTSSEDRKGAYKFLRLIAVQNEKYPVLKWNGETEVTAILRAATDNDPAHTDQLRRQDWSKPKWVNWVK